MENKSPLLEHFEGLPDPRLEGKNLYSLLDIVAIAICAVLANGETWEDMAEFGETKQAWFSQWLRLPHGIPSHDTFRRVFELLDPIAFERCFMAWVQERVLHLGV